MNSFKSINFKIIVPPFILFLIIVLFAVVIGGSFFENSTNERAEITLDSDAERLQAYINGNTNKLSDLAKLYSNMSNVKSILNKCNITNKIDSCKHAISNSLKNISSDVDYNIDIVLSNNNIVYSNNTSLNQTVLKEIVSRNLGKIGDVRLEQVYNKYYFISVLPVTYKTKNVGAVVLSKPLKEILKAFYLVKGNEIEIFNNKNKIIYSSSTTLIADDIVNEDMKNNYAFYEDFIVKNVEIKTRGINLDAYIFNSIERDISFINDLVFYLILFALGAFVIGGSIYSYGIYSTILAPVKKINDKIIVVSRGEKVAKLNFTSKDELGQIANSVDDMIEYSSRTAAFAHKIGRGELETEYNAISEKDEIANALFEMREALLDAQKEETKRKLDDEKRNWSTKGFAEFGEILRESSDNIEEFSINILRNLIKYTNSNQGGLFILNDSDKDNKVLELVASYAYDRKKFLIKEIKIGEGLVGTCAIEKELIYLTDVPDDYLDITSGLGEANPRNVILVPLQVDDKLFGVVELASFYVYEDYKQEFIVKLAESIASSLSSTKVNIMTAELLEQAQQQQEEMTAQEEELRQNMEEMLATQEESSRREAEMAGLYNAINNNSLVADFDLDGNIITINKKFADLFEVDINTFIGVNYNSITTEIEGVTREDLHTRINNGEVMSVKARFKSPNGKYYWLQQTFAPISNENGDLYKVVSISTDITKEKERELNDNETNA